MTTKTFALAAVLFLALFAGCSDDGGTPPTNPLSGEDEAAMEPEFLVGSWTRSMEEEERGGTQWFRPSQSREWTEAWLRMQYDFAADGTMQYLEMAPNDAHQMHPGTWEFSEKDDRVVLLYDENGDLIERLSFRVVALDEDLLRLSVLDR